MKIIENHWESSRINFENHWESTRITKNQFQTYLKIIENQFWESLRINFRLIQESSRFTENQFQTYLRITENCQESLRISKNQQESPRTNFRLIQESLRIAENHTKIRSYLVSFGPRPNDIDFWWSLFLYWFSLILQIILIFPLSQINSHKPHSCLCRQQIHTKNSFMVTNEEHGSSQYMPFFSTFDSWASLWYSFDLISINY